VSAVQAARLIRLTLGLRPDIEARGSETDLRSSCDRGWEGVSMQPRDVLHTQIKATLVPQPRNPSVGSFAMT
jgi:hypothetical protein